ncbi:hypothetical protein CXF72_08590 [Psychromonas sp. MB-3u-54]|uniref:hypothetical protein n=1 Tax=Psychromonas sp. MB-3u-54 TaxID=2058319 RepID=UPI000C334B04|nr:hypothetical protein [Psychromonas sp. MB-3u-54]PKH02982.1 hypothetical protein CXF72_08590 [Psychromonas sp. MB-3u-54]
MPLQSRNVLSYDWLQAQLFRRPRFIAIKPERNPAIFGVPLLRIDLSKCAPIGNSEIIGENSVYGQCDFKIDFDRDIVEPE